MKTFLRIMGLALVWGATCARGSEVTEPPYPKTNLLIFLTSWKQAPAPVGTVCALGPQWVGTVKRIYLRGGEGVYGEGETNNLRVSHLLVVKDPKNRTNLTVVRGRITTTGKGVSFSGGDAAVFMTNLPSAKTVSEAKNLDDLRKMFGPQHGITDGWGDSGRNHWTEGWTWFTVEADGRLRYLGIFAHVSSADRNTPADIDILIVTEGLLHVEDSNSIAERLQYKTGAEIEAEYEAGRAKARAVYPQPLRSLVEAREAPDDHDLTAYRRALTDVRRNPPPELFRQFAEWMHEGTGQIRMTLESVLFDGFLKLEKWGQPQRKIALRALTEALPSVTTNADLDDLIAFILQAEGGGALKLAISGNDGAIDVRARISPDGMGSTVSTGSQKISSKNLAQAAKQVRDKLKERYPNLR